MNNNLVKYSGRVEFEVPHKTKKHELQASWKRTAMILMPGDITEYYAWFIRKRFNIELIKPVRRAHVTFVNDSNASLSQGYKKPEEVDEIWDRVKRKWNGRKVDIVLDISPKFGGKHAWLRVSDEYKEHLHDIRTELGLGRPHFDYHLTIGSVNEKNQAHFDYIHGLIKKGLAN